MPGDATDGNPLAADLRALRDDAAVAARPERALLVVTGTDRGSFLQGMLSNEVAKLVPEIGELGNTERLKLKHVRSRLESSDSGPTDTLRSPRCPPATQFLPPAAPRAL